MSQSALPNVTIRSLNKFADSRGWLAEIFREDEIPAELMPAMSYISVTLPGVARGPHEHVDQTDLFVFFSGAYELHLWENRPGQPPAYEVHHVGEDNPAAIFVPPGVVHAYRNVGEKEAFVLNLPNRLYAGRGKSEPVDEIRHEDIESKFKLP
jgi:dTDP-4-dehydrorhamnose 3,5-epimerase